MGCPKWEWRWRQELKTGLWGGTCPVRRVQQGRQRTGEPARWGVPSTESPALSLMSFWATKSHPKAGMSRVHASWIKPMSLKPCCRPSVTMQQCLPCISRNSQIPSLKKSQSIKLKESTVILLWELKLHNQHRDVTALKGSTDDVKLKARAENPDTWSWKVKVSVSGNWVKSS